MPIGKLYSETSETFVNVLCYTLVDPSGIQCTETSPSGNYSDTVEGEQITLECQIGFFGLWGPTQNWTDNLGNNLAPTDLSTSNTVLLINTVSITQGPKMRCAKQHNLDSIELHSISCNFGEEKVLLTLRYKQ